MQKLTVLLVSVVTALSAFVPLVAVRADSENSQTITQKNPQGWAFVDDNGNGGSGAFVAGPVIPPMGVGSAQLSTTDLSQGYIFGKQGYAGKKFSDLNKLSYSTFVKTGNNLVAPALQFNFDPDVTDANNGWSGRAVYEPYYNGTVQDGTWQTWDALNNGNAVWWLSWSSLSNPCPASAPCTLNQLKAALPNAGVDNGALGGVLFKAGSGGFAPFVGAVDGFTIGFANTNGNNKHHDKDDDEHGKNVDVYNFEPGTEKECKNNGWQTMTFKSFTSQKQCTNFFDNYENHSASNFVLPSTDPSGITVPALSSGVYKFVVTGTWQNRSVEQVDAQCTSYNGGPWANAVTGGYDARLLNVQLNNTFVNWGACSTSVNHKYSNWLASTGSPVNVRIFDGDVATNTQDPSWFGDNVGSLNVKVVKYPNAVY